MRNVKSVFKGLGMFMYFLLSKEVVAQKIEFASTSFVSYITNGTSTWGLTFCADSATNIYIFDENGSLLSTSYIPSSGCSELIYDSAILTKLTKQVDYKY
jgi:hypothetical protein